MRSSALKKAANVISVVFHPLMMTTYLFIILSYGIPSLLYPIRPSVGFFFLIFLTTFLLPALNFLFLKISGTVSNYALPMRRDRFLPFIMVAVLYCVITFMFYWKFPVPNVLRVLVTVSFLVVLATIITFFYKVSVHSMGVWCVVGILLYLSKASGADLLLIAMAVVILVAGVVMSARLYLNAHEPSEILVGAFLGFASGFGGMFLLF